MRQSELLQLGEFVLRRDEGGYQIFKVLWIQVQNLKDLLPPPPLLRPFNITL